jgi:hypothetical protein
MPARCLPALRGLRYMYTRPHGPPWRVGSVPQLILGWRDAGTGVCGNRPYSRNALWALCLLSALRELPNSWCCHQRFNGRMWAV